MFSQSRCIPTTGLFKNGFGAVGPTEGLFWSKSSILCLFHMASLVPSARHRVECPMGSVQGQHTFCKVPGSKCLRPVGHMIPVTCYLFCFNSLKMKNDS